MLFENLPGPPSIFVFLFLKNSTTNLLRKCAKALQSYLCFLIGKSMRNATREFAKTLRTCWCFFCYYEINKKCSKESAKALRSYLCAVSLGIQREMLFKSLPRPSTYICVFPYSEINKKCSSRKCQGPPLIFVSFPTRRSIRNAPNESAKALHLYLCLFLYGSQQEIFLENVPRPSNHICAFLLGNQQEMLSESLPKPSAHICVFPWQKTIRNAR